MQEEIGHECIKLLTSQRLKFILEGFSSSVYTGFSYPSKFLKYFFFYQYISILSNKKTRSKCTVSILQNQISQILISFTLKFTLWFQVDDFIIYWALYAKTWGEMNTKAGKNLKVHVFFQTRLCEVYTKTRRNNGNYLIPYHIKSFLVGLASIFKVFNFFFFFWQYDRQHQQQRVIPKFWG